MNREEIKKEIERLQGLLNKKEKWTPQVGDEYWAIDGTIEKYTNIGEELDEWNIITGNAFETEAEAKEYRDFIFAVSYAKYEFTEEEWKNNDILKWNIEYNSFGNNYRIGYTFDNKSPNNIYFKTQKEAEAFLKKI